MMIGLALTPFFMMGLALTPCLTMGLALYPESGFIYFNQKKEKHHNQRGDFVAHFSTMK
jgi:hypothetical protein